MKLHQSSLRHRFLFKPLVLFNLALFQVSNAQEPIPVPFQASKGVEISNPETLAPPRPKAIPRSDSPPDTTGALKLDFSEVIRRVLLATPSLEKVESRIRQAESRVQEAFAPAYPNINFSAQYSRVQPPVSFPGGAVVTPANNYNLSLVIRQAILTFGRLKWGVLASKLNKRSNEEDYRTEVNRLVLLIAQRYIEALLAQEQVTIAEDDLEAQLANLRISKLLFEQGVAARFDVLRNSSAVSQAQQTLLEARTNVGLSNSRILSLLDEPLTRELNLEALAIRAPNPDLALEDAKQQAMNSRPDLRSLRWAIEEAKARVELSRSNSKPTLEIQNTTVNRNSTGFAANTQNTTALVLSVPIFDGGVSRHQRAQAEETVLQLLSDLEEAERNATLQIAESFQQLANRWKAISVAEENVLQANEALRVAVLRYENGISTNVELLESQAARSQARFSLSQARGNYLLSRWNFWQATAGDYPTEVPFPQQIQERLDAEGLPSGLNPWTKEDSGSRLGPEQNSESIAPELPIRGLQKKAEVDDETSNSDNLDKE